MRRYEDIITETASTEALQAYWEQLDDPEQRELTDRWRERMYVYASPSGLRIFQEAFRRSMDTEVGHE